MKQIKPCPFCGSENLSVGGFENYIKCKNCGAAGPDGSTLNEAFNKWNSAPRKEEVEAGKSCANCRQLYKDRDGKYRCGKSINETYNCHYWEASIMPYESCLKDCTTCKHLGVKFVNNDTVILNCCDHEIPHPENYVCHKWEETSAPLPLCNKPLNPENSSGLKTLCEKAISKWGEAAQINKAIEELSELVIALTRYQNLNLRDEDYQEKAYKILDNIHEEREDVEIMLRQLDVIFGRSEEWQRKKYAHLQLIVGDTENE